MGEIEMTRSTNSSTNNDEDAVEILLKTLGPAPPSPLNSPRRIKVHDLRKLVAGNKHLPFESLSLILRGSVLRDTKNGEEQYIKLANGDSLIVSVKPKAPPKHIQAGFDDDEEEDNLKFQLPESTSRWKWRLFWFLRDKLKFPDIILIGIFSLSTKAWITILVWFILAPIAHKWNLGPLYILGTGFALIFLNLGQRQEGDLSAYSIFNEDFRELPGTLNADRIDRDLRAGKCDLFTSSVDQELQEFR